MSTDRATIRKRAGMTLRQLSNASGISISRLSTFERGESRLSATDVATVSAILKQRLDQTPIFTTDTEVFHFLEAGA